MRIPNQLNVTYGAVLPNGRRISERAESNAVSTEILTYSVLKEIRSDKTIVRAGERAHNTVTVTNRSAAKLFGNYLTISQPNEANFIAGSVKINGVAQPAYDPITGFALPDLAPGETAIIEYEIKAVKPTEAPVTHFATVRYTVADPARGNVNYAENTDTLSLNVIADIIGNSNPTVIRIPVGYGTIVSCEDSFCCCDCCNCCDWCEC